MPIYEYRCESCEDQFEAMQKMSARPLRKCKKCGGKLEKLLSRTSFVLRGGGWYSDGYTEKSGKAEGTKKQADASKKTADKGSADAASKSKPSAKEKPSGGAKKVSKPSSK